MNVRHSLLIAMFTVAALTAHEAKGEETPAVKFFRHQFVFGDHRGIENSSKTETISIKRPNPSEDAKVLLTLCGFDVSFSEGDHHLQRFAINVEEDGFGPYIEGVPVKVSILLRDRNGDDQFKGSVDVGVIVIDSPTVHVYKDTKTFGQTSGTGPQTGSSFIAANVPNFDRVSFLRGFDIQYGDSDHHVYAIDAAAQAATLPREGAQYDAATCELGLRDSSNVWDDGYGGSIHFSMLRFPKGTLYLDRGEATVDGNHGPLTKDERHFSQSVLNAKNVFAALSGVHLSYVGKDHHVTRLASSVSVANVAAAGGRTEIDIRYTGDIEDDNGDDSMRARGQYVVIAGQ